MPSPWNRSIITSAIRPGSANDNFVRGAHALPSPITTKCLPPNSAQMEPATGCVSLTPGDYEILPIFEGVMLVSSDLRSNTEA